MSAWRICSSQPIDTPPDTNPGLFLPWMIGAHNGWLMHFGKRGPAYGVPMGEVDPARHPLGSLLGPAALGTGAGLSWAAHLMSMDPLRPQYEELSWGGPMSTSYASMPHGGIAPDLTAQALYFPPLNMAQRRGGASFGKRILEPSFAGWL